MLFAAYCYVTQVVSCLGKLVLRDIQNTRESVGKVYRIRTKQFQRQHQLKSPSR